ERAALLREAVACLLHAERGVEQQHDACGAFRPGDVVVLPRRQQEEQAEQGVDADPEESQQDGPEPTDGAPLAQIHPADVAQAAGSLRFAWKLKCTASACSTIRITRNTRNSNGPCDRSSLSFFLSFAPGMSWPPTGGFSASYQPMLPRPSVVPLEGRLTSLL